MFSKAQVSQVMNRIKRLSPAERQDALRFLLSGFQDDWLAEVVALATAEHERRRQRRAYVPLPQTPYRISL